MHQPLRTTPNLAVQGLIEKTVRAYAEQHGVELAKVPPYALAREFLKAHPELSHGPLSETGWTHKVQEVRDAMVQRATATIERGRGFAESTRPASLHDVKPLPESSPLMLIGHDRSPSPPRRKKPSPRSGDTRNPKFLEALAAMESRSSGKVLGTAPTGPRALGIRPEQLMDPRTLDGGLVLTDFPDLAPVGQGRVEVHAFRWAEQGIDPLGTGAPGTSLVIRTRHWLDKIEGEGASFLLSLVGGRTLPVEIRPVQPDQHCGVVVLNLSDAQLSEMIGTQVGRNLTFKVDAQFTDPERPKGRHTQKCEFSIPTEHVAEVRRVRVPWAPHESVDINLPRTDGVVAILKEVVPQLQSMTTMMETEAEFVLPEDFDMFSARGALFELATNPEQAASILGEGWQAYPADKYIRKNLEGLSAREYDALPMTERSAFWVHGPDGLPATIGHTDTILDTPDRALLSRGLIMRVRANERGTVVSLKSVSQPAAGLDSRVRFCVDACLDKGTSEEDAIRIAHALLAHEGPDELDPNPFIEGLRAAGVEVGTGGLKLVPTLQVESARDRVRLVDSQDSSNIELSLDRSTLTPYDEEGVLQTERATTSMGFEFGLEHSGVSPQDHHGVEAEVAPPREAVAGFRGFHVPSDLDHGSLHDPTSTRNRALLHVVSGLTGPIFGDETALSPGGFKAAQGAEALGLITGAWREVVAQRERQ